MTLTNGEVIQTILELMPFASEKKTGIMYIEHNSKKYTIELVKLDEDKNIVIKTNGGL